MADKFHLINLSKAEIDTKNNHKIQFADSSFFEFALRNYPVYEVNNFLKLIR